MTEPYQAIPEGWYAVAWSSELPVGAVRPLRAFGDDWVLYRTASGRAALREAYCPHLGAHLGHGGTVVGEHLRCPFHGFEFDGDGRCARTAYGAEPPRRARLRALPLREQHGVLLAYFHPDGAEPDWEVPDVGHDGWSGYAPTTLELRGHPQETSENSVDFGHLGELHGFLGAEVVRPARVEGRTLSARYRFRRSFRDVGLPLLEVPAEFDVWVHGLGFSLVDGVLPGLGGARFRNLVLSTPVDAEHVVVRLGAAVWLPPAVPAPLRRVVGRVAARAAGFFLRREVLQDAPIWQHKRYVERPALARGDGPIGLYRRYCRQFYPGAPAGDLSDVAPSDASLTDAPLAG